MTAYNFKEFQEKGLLWAINRYIFHPRGLAMMMIFDDETNETTWSLLTTNTPPFSFDDETDDSGYEIFTAFLKEQGNV